MTVSGVLVALTMLILAAAVALLFAMLAEVNARLPLAGDATSSGAPSVLEEAKLGVSPTEWPPILSPLVQNEGDALLLVLSPSCSACESVGSQLSSRLDKAEFPSNLAVIVACSSEAVGYDFVRRHALDRSITFVDHGGEWISTAFGVQTSPAALRIRDGILESAVVFNALSTLEPLGATNAN
jgi:hypothetical protein